MFSVCASCSGTQEHDTYTDNMRDMKARVATKAIALLHGNVMIQCSNRPAKVINSCLNYTNFSVVGAIILYNYFCT